MKMFGRNHMMSWKVLPLQLLFWEAQNGRVVHHKTTYAAWPHLWNYGNVGLVLLGRWIYRMK
jgi:hypothetical protein